MELPGGEDPDQHRLHCVVVERRGREPEWAVGHAAALGVEVKHVGALLH